MPLDPKQRCIRITPRFFLSVLPRFHPIQPRPSSPPPLPFAPPSCAYPLRPLFSRLPYRYPLSFLPSTRPLDKPQNLLALVPSPFCCNSSLPPPSLPTKNGLSPLCLSLLPHASVTSRQGCSAPRGSSACRSGTAVGRSSISMGFVERSCWCWGRGRRRPAAVW